METKEKAKNTHHGHAIKFFRQAQGLKQEALAADVGICQQMISTYESKKEIDDEMLDKFAAALKVPANLIKEMEENPLTVIIEHNTFTCEEGSIGNLVGDNVNNYNNTAIDKILELSSEKEALLERMLEMQREKTALLEDLLRGRK